MMTIPDITTDQYIISHDKDADPIEVARVCEWTCRYCGELVAPKRFQERPKGVAGKGKWVRVYDHKCREQEESRRALKLWEDQQKADESSRLWYARMKRAGLIGRLEDCTFENFISRDDFVDAIDIKERVKNYIQALLAGKLKDKNWLVMAGTVGTGKTHLAAALVREALVAGKEAYFRSWTEYLQRIQASWDRRDDEQAERESDILDELNKGWLVVIDDIDKRRSSEWVKESLYSFLNTRHLNKLPTVITLNTRLQDTDPLASGRLALHDILGGAVLDRTIESMAAYIEFDAASYRSKKKWSK
jgi:DNA replication protein DnaC